MSHNYKVLSNEKRIKLNKLSRDDKNTSFSVTLHIQLKFCVHFEKLEYCTIGISVFCVHKSEEPVFC